MNLVLDIIVSVVINWMKIKMDTLENLKKAEELLINIRQEHWAIGLALEYVQQAYEEIRDVGLN